MLWSAGRKIIQITEKCKPLPHEVCVQIDVGYEQKRFLIKRLLHTWWKVLMTDDELLLLFQGCQVH